MEQKEIKTKRYDRWALMNQIKKWISKKQDETSKIIKTPSTIVNE